MRLPARQDEGDPGDPTPLVAVWRGIRGLAAARRWTIRHTPDAWVRRLHGRRPLEHAAGGVLPPGRPRGLLGPRGLAPGRDRRPSGWLQARARRVSRRLPPDERAAAGCCTSSCGRTAARRWRRASVPRRAGTITSPARGAGDGGLGRLRIGGYRPRDDRRLVRGRPGSAG
jgi:hypothetical protein